MAPPPSGVPANMLPASLDGEHPEELRDAAMEDIVRHGARRRLNSAGDLVKLGANGKAAPGKHAELVKQVMGTTGGDNEKLARKVHARYNEVGLRQPSVEVRFDDLTISSMIPEGSTEGLFTVGVDLMVKGLTAVAAATRQKPPMQEVKIVQNISGVFKPGRLTLVLGPPGGGKSMLMKACCGAAPAAVTGDLLYNGRKQSEFNVTRTARYVDQVDLHNPALTVRETLTFSAMCQGPGYHRSMLKLLEEKEQKMGVTPDPEIKELMAGLHHDEDPSCNVALTLQLLMLTNCADTIVGDGMTRGISGGERKRVTTGEILVGPSKVLFMDQISTGLDSASTFTIVQSLRNLTHATDATIVVALLQPEPQVYDLFDDVMLMANGRVAYQGPRTAVEPHFASLGFECTGQKAVADFLQELVSEKDQPAIRVDRSKFEPQQDFVPAAAFAAAFKRSDVFRDTRALLDTPFDEAGSHPASLMKSQYGVTGWGACSALLWRERILLTANKQDQLYRYIQMAFLAFVVATVFVRSEVTNTDNLQGAGAALGAMVFSVAYMQFLGLAECANTMMALPLFWKQKFALFFPSWAYAVPFAVVRLPITFIEVTFWSVTVYWIVGLESDAGRFFTFWAILVCTQLASSSLYRAVGSCVRALVAGTSVAVIVMLVTFIGMGFVLLQDQMPRGWAWMFWVSPLQYVLTGLVNNEFLGESWRDAGALDPAAAPQGVGRKFLTDNQFNVGEKWRWIAVLVLLAYFVVLNLINMAALTFLPPPPMPPPPPAPQEDEYALGGEQGPAEAKRSDVVVPITKAASEGANGTSNGVSAATPKNDMTLPFEPITLAFEDLRYYVPDPSGHGELELLRGVYGVFRPGVLTALMGASGAGKTTLMDVLADRKTAGHHTGTVTVNGAKKEPAAFARVMGYCEQFDVHSSGTTVEEAVRQSALLRLGDSVSAAEREEFVQQTLRVVELDTIAGGIVGIPGMFGLSGEQFKRLTIAVELVANPAIIFLDEPTTGLDARAAQIVMRVVRNIVNNDRTIVCTIHQPSAEIFHHFDELLLLKRGGWPIYYGPLGEGARDLVSWFEAVPGCKPLTRGYNPATYMLEVSTAEEEERLGVDFHKNWEERGKAGAVAAVAAGVAAAENAKPPSFAHAFAQGRWVQYTTLLKRYFKAYWRSPPYNTTRLILSVVSALILGTYYFERGDNLGSAADVTGILGALFICVVFSGFLNFQMIIPTFWMERPVMFRERASRLYSVLPWVQAMQDVEIPWIALQVSIFSVIAYFMIHFEFDAGKFFFFWIALFLSCLTMAYLGMLMVCVTPNLSMGVTAGATTLGVWFLFAGFIIPRPATPAWWRWVIFLCPPSWGIYGIVADQLGDKDGPEHVITYFVGSEQRDGTIKEYVNDVFDFEYGFRWWALLILAAFVVALRLAVVLAVKFINFQKR